MKYKIWKNFIVENYHNNNYRGKLTVMKRTYFIIPVLCYDHSFISIYIDDLFISISTIVATIGWFSNSVSTQNWFITSQARFVAVRKIVFGFLMMLILTFSKVISSFSNDTKEFWFNCLISLRLGTDVQNGANVKQMNMWKVC